MMFDTDEDKKKVPKSNEQTYRFDPVHNTSEHGLHNVAEHAAEDESAKAFLTGRKRGWCSCCRSFCSEHPRTCTAVFMFVFLCLPFWVALAYVASSSQTQTASNGNDADPWQQYYASSQIGAVSSDVAACSRLGADIMEAGGNAMDAAVTVGLCVGALSPASSGIGGGCFIVSHNATSGLNEFVDAREVAPAEAFPTMYVNDSKLAQNGGLAIAVPSEIRGFYHAWQRLGSGHLSWSDVVLPVADVAEAFEVSPMLAYHISETEDEGIDLHSGDYPELAALILREDGSYKQAGDMMYRPQLAETLRNIAAEGPDYLYDTMAATLAEEIRTAGGTITEWDIRNYSVMTHDPIVTDFMGHTYIGAAGSSSGGVVVAGILKYMDAFTEPLISMGSLYYHRLAEAYKHAFAIRMGLADPAFVDISGPRAALLSDDYMANLAIDVSEDDHVLPKLAMYGGKYNITTAPQLPLDGGTSHWSVLDRHGNAVAITSTVNTYFGSKVVSPSTGIVFNNEMDDFSIPNSANHFGLSPNVNNFPVPGKRPLSSMSPSIVLDANGGTRMIGGASGGPKIITSTAQVILNTIARGMDLLSAIKHFRLHSQLLPDIVKLENFSTILDLPIHATEQALDALTSRGHTVYMSDHLAYAQFILVDPDTGLIEAVADPRKDGQPAGL